MKHHHLHDLHNLMPQSHDGRTLVSNFGYLTLLQFAGYLFPLITVPYLARVIGAEGYGRIAFATAVITWVQTVADWGFTMTATRDVARCRDNAAEVSRIFSETFWARCLLMVVSFVVLALLIIAVPLFRESADILLISFLLVPGHIMFPDWFFQAMERMKYTTITNLVVKIFFTVAVFVVIRESDDYIYQPLLTSAGYLVAGAIAMHLILRKWGYRLHRVPLRRVLRAIKGSTDVFVNTIFPNLYNSLSVVMLGFFGGPVANGIYSEGSKMSGICQQFLGVIPRVFFPFLSRKIDAHRRFVRIYMGATVVAAVGLFFGAPLIIRLLYTDEFAASVHVLRIMAVSLIFLSMSNAYGSNYLIAAGHEKILRKITMWCSIGGFIIAVPLVYCFTYIGVALTVALSRASIGIASLLAVRKVKSVIGGG